MFGLLVANLMSVVVGNKAVILRRCRFDVTEISSNTPDMAANELLDGIQRGLIRREKLEVIISHYDESLEWSRPFGPIRTVYSKGNIDITENGIKVHRLKNVGREQHSYVWHIVNNYDSLAERTVFLHGRAPSCGFFGGVFDAASGQSVLGNHLLTNVSAMDYLTAPLHMVGSDSPPAAFMPLTVRMYGEWDACSIRSGFADLPDSSPLHIRRVPHPVSPYPPGGDGFQGDLASAATMGITDVWLPWERCDTIREYVHSKHQGPVTTFLNYTQFWQTVFGKSPPPVVVFAQGAQFAASADAIRRVPLAIWKWLLSQLEGGHEEVEYCALTPELDRKP